MKQSKLLITMLLLVVVFHGFIISKNKKHYVSTTGMAFFLKQDIKLWKDFLLIKIEEKGEVQSVKNFIFARCDKNHKSFFSNSLILNQILESKDYTKTNCYVVISPKTENSTINQPYYFNDTEDLIFEIKIGEIRKHAYMYIRIYDVSNKKDIFNKYFSIGGEKKLLNAISPKDLKISS